MRTLEECRAEVFRRSKNRISARNKRRKCAFALCIPTVLCMVFCIWQVKSANEYNDEIDSTRETWGTEVGKVEFDLLSISRIDVTWGDESISCTDVERVRKIASILGSASVSYGNRTPIATSPDVEEKSQGITVVLDDGDVMEFCLVGHVLTSEAISCSLYLSQDHVDELCRLLRVSTE